eukprot:2780976-Alexandrium_andersonii.AAC.1
MPPRLVEEAAVAASCLEPADASASMSGGAHSRSTCPTLKPSMCAEGHLHWAPPVPRRAQPEAVAVALSLACSVHVELWLARAQAPAPARRRRPRLLLHA